MWRTPTAPTPSYRRVRSFSDGVDAATGGPGVRGSGFCADWEAPYYRVRAAGFQVLFLVEPDEVIEEVCNVDAEVHLADGSRWSSTIFTLAEVDRLMRS